MFKRLQQKWKVTGWQLALILSTFAIGGSMCGFLTRKIITPLSIENNLLSGTLYFVILTILWPFCVLIISIPLGQFVFFRNYLRKMGSRLGLSTPPPEPAAPHQLTQIAIFASGTGSNARKIMEHFQHHPRIRVAMLVSNRPGAGALHFATDFGISTLLVEKEAFMQGHGYVPALKAAGIDFIVLAGFLWKIPPVLIAAYPKHIVNIHPALLPKFGGKGMYGLHVHEAVLASRETTSGITIHLVDELYDHGTTLFQATCPVLPQDSPEQLAARILQLEHLHFATTIEQWIEGKLPYYTNASAAC